MAPPPRCLRDSVAKDDDSWHFTIPREFLSSNQPGHGKMVQFKTVESGAKIMFQMAKFSNNRVIQNDDINEFVLVSFSLPGRQAEWTLKDGGEYIARFLERGLFINDVQYRFYHHSASQLKERRCFLRRANTDAELDERIYKLGDFGKIMNPAKRAKRIGLLYSESQVDYILNPVLKEDIHDLQYGDEVFSDGCGLMSRKLAIEVSKKKKIIFRGKRYTPSVFQIRYLGYKGVLMLHPPMDRANELSRKMLQSLKEKQATSSSLTPDEETFLSAPPPPVWAQFRRSMKKFTTEKTPTFSVVGYSKPYAFGRLNNEIIVLLSSLGITAENLLLRQQDYFDWIVHASQKPEDAIDLLSAVGEYDAAERVLLDGLDAVLPVVRKCQRKEVGDFKREDGKERSRTIIKRSRKIYGVCDPFKVLKEGEVHIRITEGRGGVSTVRGCDVLVVRNPCLNPGDCLKLRAVECPALAHLVDCVVFASVARPGHHSAPSMSSGGDLDGDEYFVCWDPLLVPSVRHEAYDYPPNKERLFTSLTRQDLARHFANYNNASLGRVSNLHNRWATASPKGARCSECQELSALHSQCVDGARIKIPDRLVSPPGRPEGSEPWIIDQLKENASRFAEKFLSESVKTQGVADSADNESHATQIILGLLQSRPVGLALSEYELFTMACRVARRQGLNPHTFFQYLDCGALTTSQKYALIAAMPDLNHEEYARLWNSLWRSDLIGPQQLYSRNIAQSFRIQRLYSSNIHGTEQFFSYLSMAFQDFTRKILLIKTDAHFALAIFMRGQIAWDDDVDVDENLVVCSFLPHSTSEFSSYKQSPKGFRLHCGPGRLQLYDRHIANSFIYIGIQPRATGPEVVTSVALQKISKQVQLNIGRVNKKPLTEIELHVVSNRDTIAHQLFDLWFEHVPTEERIRRFDRDPRPYKRFSLNDINWNEGPPPTDSEFVARIFKTKPPKDGFMRLLDESDKSQDWLDAMRFAVHYRAENQIFWIFEFVLSRPQPLLRATITEMLALHPPLVYYMLKTFPPVGGSLAEPLRGVTFPVLQTIIRSANDFAYPALIAIGKMATTISHLPVEEYLELLWDTALCMRAPELCQEVLLELNDARSTLLDMPPALDYLRKFGMGVAADRADEAGDECPCAEDGRPKKQRTAPVKTTLTRVVDAPRRVKAVLRVDASSPIRLHSHVRLVAKSELELDSPDHSSDLSDPMIDALVVSAFKGEVTLEAFQPWPPEVEEMNWNMYHAGSIATSKAMMDALKTLGTETYNSCGFYNVLVGEEVGDNDQSQQEWKSVYTNDATMNESQQLAVDAIQRTPLSLIWGPPGTGKTTVVVQILLKILQDAPGSPRILMTASTHNAVDNVLERFVELNQQLDLLPQDKILRVATDIKKVKRSLMSYTVDARVGGELIENNKLLKEAQKRLEAASVVFSTCAGAGLGILRKSEFDVALIDEASQVTEPCALIPLVKGVKRGILVGDHVQLRPMVRKLGAVLQFDVSLMERLYKGAPNLHVSKTMLDIQYRFPQELAEFPSREFYEGRLRSGLPNAHETLLGLPSGNTFPWPRTRQGVPIPCIFIPCDIEEEQGGMSKHNLGQIALVQHLLETSLKHTEDFQLSITNLSPYGRQIKELKSHIPGVDAYTVDSFQGRESDIIIFSSVRCNVQHDIGFLTDERRLNVMWTRARRALIIIGDKSTLQADPLWRRALESCAEVRINMPERPEIT